MLEKFAIFPKILHNFTSTKRAMKTYPPRLPVLQMVSSPLPVRRAYSGLALSGLQLD